MFKFILSFYIRRNKQKSCNDLWRYKDGVAWLFINSRNTEKALIQPSKALSGFQNIYFGYRSELNLPNSINVDPTRHNRKKFQALFFLCYVLFTRKYSARFYRKIIRHYYLYEYFNNLFEIRKPAVVFIANDHLPYARALTLSSKNKGIPVVYFQHAHIGEDFPSLIFDVSFLYGQASKDIYLKKNPKAQTYKIGSFNRCEGNDNKFRNVIGMAFSPLDNIEDINHKISFCQRKFNNSMLLVRFHPRFDDAKKSQIHQLQFRDYSTRSLCEFLNDIDVLISGPSSIILDAALNEVLPILYITDKEIENVYDFESKGLCIRASNYNEIGWYVNNRNYYLRQIINQVGYYDEGFKQGYTTEDQIKIVRKTLRHLLGVV